MHVAENRDLAFFKGEKIPFPVTDLHTVKIILSEASNEDESCCLIP
jgi:hypothetical protein